MERATQYWMLSLVALAGCMNVRPVERDVLYRSGQLPPVVLEREIKEKKIRTVVNLRGFDPNQVWYLDERKVCERNGVELVDLPIDARHPTSAEVRELLDVYRDAEKPILIHSRWPEGRVGLASALYRTEILDDDSEQAKGELAVWNRTKLPIHRLQEPGEFLTVYSDRSGEIQQVSAQTTSVARIPVPEPGAGPKETVARKPTFTMTARKQAEVVADWWTNDMDVAYYAESANHTKIETGKVVTDYSSFLGDGPSSRGPTLIGRTKTWGGPVKKPRSVATKGAKPANPAPKGPTVTLGMPLSDTE